MIRDLVMNHRIIVCCGTGGVGKTTTSAALALAAARMGKRAVVITIDPAKRLATSLGMKALSDEPVDLTANVKEAAKAQGETLTGSFSALVPDSEKTFEEFVRSVGGGDENRIARVLRTSIYKIFTKEFSGAHEYMAMQKLYQVSQMLDRGEADLIVLDTPPSANTRFFLDAPLLMAAFFDEGMVKWMLAPGGKLLSAGVGKMVDLLEKLTGKGFVTDLIEFTRALFDLRSQFQDNLKRVSELLHKPGVAFLMVTTPERLQKNDAQAFVDKIKRENYPFWGFIANRVLHLRLGTPDGEAKPSAALKKAATDAEIEALQENFAGLAPQLKQERLALSYLQALGRVVEVAEQSSDVASIEALYEVSKSYA